MNYPLSNEEYLEDVTADLVAEPRNRAFLQRLLTSTPGALQRLEGYLISVPHETTRLQHALALTEGELYAMWIPYPSAPMHAVIIFIAFLPLWTSSAIFSNFHSELGLEE